MRNIWRYILLFVITLLLQLFLLDRMTVGVWFVPLVYTAALILLPLNTPSFVVLLTGLATGLAADLTTGTAGLNVIAALPAAYLRRPLLRIFCSRELMRETLVPSPETMGRFKFILYASSIISLHSLIFHLFEALSLSHLGRTLLLSAVGAGETLVFICIIAVIFTVKNNGRL